MTPNKIVSRGEWLAARTALLAREKQLTRAADDLAAARRALPWVEITAPYVFDTADGKATLGELFAGKSQLVVYHLMFAPDWKAACKSCSFWADHFDSLSIHLPHRDARFMAISRAPLATLQAYARRMGWTFPWASSHASSFNYDFGASFTPEQLAAPNAYNFGTAKAHGPEQPGVSAFVRDDAGRVFHTYSCYGRGIEPLNTTYRVLDLLAKGRDEGERPMSWVRLHDEYGA